MGETTEIIHSEWRCVCRSCLGSSRFLSEKVLRTANQFLDVSWKLLILVFFSFFPRVRSSDSCVCKLDEHYVTFAHHHSGWVRVA